MNKQEYLAQIQRVIEKGPYKDTWESLSRHPIPQWYQDAKLGIFIHWGIYSVPAYGNEWYPTHMYEINSDICRRHREIYGENFEYHDFIPQFTGEKFDPEAWLNLFEDCGAAFIMPTAEHHDGFKMYDSQLNRWNAVQMGPRRDVLGELKEACDRRGIRLAASSHRAEHFWFMGGMMDGKQDVARAYPDFYGPCARSQDGKPLVPTKEWMEDWLVSSCEIVDKYQISSSYFDYWTAQEPFRPYMRKFLAYYYNRAQEWGREVVSFYKFDAALYPCGVYVCERGQMDGICRDVWQCETSTAYNSWGYCTTNQFKKPEEIICNMIDVWSKNGCMALNIGPKADGTICEEEQQILKAIARWTRKNRDAIWGTFPYRLYGEGVKQKSGSFCENYHYTRKDYRFTARLGKLYVFAMVPQGRKTFKIRTLSFYGGCNAIVKEARILGEDTPVRFTPEEDGLRLTLPKPVREPFPICFELTVV